MKSEKKYIPTDSEEKEVQENKVVKPKISNIYRKEEPQMKTPEKSKKHSEQPPTAHNNHT